MKSFVLGVCFSVTIILGVAGTASAGLVNLTLKSSGNIVDNNTYVGPYTAQVTGGSTIQIICDNYNQPVHVGLNWNATMETFSTPNFTSIVKFGTATTSLSASAVLMDYEAAAWLAQKIMADYNSITSKNASSMDQQIGDLQYALLAIFSSSAKSSRGFDSQAAIYYWDAFHPTVAYNLSQFSDVVFYTPDPLSASQEYIMITPEPVSALLFGTGLLFILGVTRKKRLG